MRLCLLSAPLNFAGLVVGAVAQLERNARHDVSIEPESAGMRDAVAALRRRVETGFDRTSRRTLLPGRDGNVSERIAVNTHSADMGVAVSMSIGDAAAPVDAARCPLPRWRLGSERNVRLHITGLSPALIMRWTPTPGPGGLGTALNGTGTLGHVDSYTVGHAPGPLARSPGSIFPPYRVKMPKPGTPGRARPPRRRRSDASSRAAGHPCDARRRGPAASPPTPSPVDHQHRSTR